MYRIFFAAAVGITAAACNGTKAPENISLNRAVETLDSMYSHYGVEDCSLLRENYPSDVDYRATYLASDAPDAPNAFSYLWPFSGSLSAVRAIYSATGDTAWLGVIDEKVLPGLECYRDLNRTPAAFASYINTAPASDRFYDDNVWLGIDFAELYQASGCKKYLDEAVEIWKFIESGTDSILGGGIYWCEQKKHSKNTCSNAPGTVYAVRLYEATGDSVYLQSAKELYDWTRENLQDPEDKLYFDNVNLEGNISKAKFAYNSGQMLEAAALLYKATGDSAYLAQAQEIAASAFPYFFNGGTAVDEQGEFPLLNSGNIWFTTIMMRGFMELYLIDGNPEYMNAFDRNLNYAWNSMRDPETGLFSEDWSGKTHKDRKWLLTQNAMAEMYATIVGISK